MLEPLTSYGIANPTMAGYEQKVQESSSCSVHEVGSLFRTNLALKAWRIPGEPLIFSLYEKANEAIGR